MVANTLPAAQSHFEQAVVDQFLKGTTFSGPVIFNGSASFNSSATFVNLNTTGTLSEQSQRVYSAGNPPPYPVTSVAGRGGAVTLGAADVAAGTFPSGTFTFQNVALTGSLSQNADGIVQTFDHPTSGGWMATVYRSRVNLGSDQGFLLYDDDWPATGGERSRFTIGVFNDVGTDITAGVADHLRLEGNSAIVFNTGTWDARLNGQIGAVSGALTSGTAFMWRVNDANKATLDYAGNFNTVGSITENGVRVYSASNPPPYPVTSVAGRGGAVSLTAADVGIGTFPAGRFAYNGELDLTATAVTAAGTGGGVGDKISLWGSGSTGYGIGIQSNRLVAYMPSGASFSVRSASGTGNASSGTEQFIVQASNGNVSTNGTVDPALGSRNRYVVRVSNTNTAPGMGSGATITSGLTNVITWSGIESTSGANASSMWASANPSRFVAPVAGFYLINWSGWFTNASSTRLIQRIRRNGTADIWEFDTFVQGGTGACGGGGGSCLTYLAANDYIELIYTPQDANLAYNTGNFASPRMTMALVGVA